ncbi:P-loop ATPase, Sll1717 family [Acinetobacter baumannii]|uniref:FunZ protein n=1 Tax=Acinetobacter baumannii TaxID=470 RepID=A0AAP1QUD8_ACIBA|nr:funZ protein [Acinetobacter baumannii]MBD2851054.1 funZ protein [Acinetobacter baumannii]MBD3132588.1 funZ protein [Acinetobacter baumannii]MBE0308526.1 funZ protein [Acinetobacter baumannii]MBE0311279.1 funZ protein [Acinetobacter baumannii]MBE0328871.1 funZ protein [Acinetobacter baumannii]
MKKFQELNFGFADAINYKRRENKKFFNSLFIKDHHLDKLCEPNISFLIGEKGTGKTAYSIYLSNNNYKNHYATTKYIRETDYATFIKLKKENHLTISEFTSIWKVIILLIISKQVIDNEGDNILSKLFNYNKFSVIQDVIEEYYYSAFNPEIGQAISFAEQSKIAAELLSKIAVLKGEESLQKNFTENRLQLNLFYIQKKFEEGLSQLKLNKNHIIFIDGIDIRPHNIDFESYLDCIRGLGNAIWELNNDFFPSIKGSKGRLRAVMLIRPDIFESMGLHNQNTKIRDNSVYLDWRTEYGSYRNSMLFEVIDHLFSSQQDNKILKKGETWNLYFPWDTPNVNIPLTTPSSFIYLLRWSYYRPRDILTLLSILQENLKNSSEKSKITFSDIEDANFKRKYSNYLLGEVKDQLSFYYTLDDYELFLKFFDFLSGMDKFNYDFYSAAYSKLIDHIESLNKEIPQFMATKNDFLQFLFDLNVICYIETGEKDHKRHFHWCFKDRSYSNISPKVKTHVEYEIFYGLAKALNVGRKVK